MELEFCNPNTGFNSNESTRIDYSIWKVIPNTVINYFYEHKQWNYENVYFLFLALFQLATIHFIPREWSPTGPYSTAIPLLICIIIEILTNLIKYYKDWKLDQNENNKEYLCLNPTNNKTYRIKNQNIYPGNVIHLQKEDICPIDGILLDTSNNEKFSKISLALLTGESNLHYVVKPYKFYKNQDYINAKLIVNDYCHNSFHNIVGKIVKKDKEYNVQGDNFIVAGSIIKSDDVYIWITACGKDKKSYLKNNISTKNNTLDQFVRQYMISINATLLVFLILLMTTIKLIFLSSFTLHNFVFNIIQNWILFNGIIPFSIKIFLIFARNLQSYFNNTQKNIIINNTTQMDDIGKIKKILSDKTGTITKNELEFTNLLEVWKNNIIDVKSYDPNYNEIGSEFHKCLGLCIHQTDDNYSTVEDKTIRYRYQYLNNKITQSGNEITLIIDNNRYDYKYIEIGGLDFTFERKMSSKIVKSENRYYIYCKGSMDTISNKIKDKYKTEFKRLDDLISTNNPELRLLACAFREITSIELSKAMADSINTSTMIAILENNLNFLGIIGIKDNLQIDVKNIVSQYEKQFGIPVCLLTGDRKITAMAIAKEAGLITGEIYDYTAENNIIDQTIAHKTLLFNGTVLNTCDIKEFLIVSKNFIGYNLMPEHKKYIATTLENNGIKTLTIGDGFNDIGMFNASSMSVAIRGNEHVEQQADFTIKDFKQLTDVWNLSLNSYQKNSNLINFTFYRSAAVIFTLVTYCLINYNQVTNSLFNGFVLQAFNFAWLLFGLTYYTLVDNKNTYDKVIKYVSFPRTTLWNLSGIITGISLTLLNYYWFNESDYIHDISGLVLIAVLNIKLFCNNIFDKWGLLTSIVGIGNFMLYMLYNGSLFQSLYALLSAGMHYWILLFGGYLIISFFFA